MKKAMLCAIVFALMGCVGGCSKEPVNVATDVPHEETGDFQYAGKIFTIQALFQGGQSATVKTWENATNVSHKLFTFDTDSKTYTFYVNGKMIEIYNPTSAILTETGKTK